MSTSGQDFEPRRSKRTTKGQMPLRYRDEEEALSNSRGIQNRSNGELIDDLIHFSDNPGRSNPCSQVHGRTPEIVDLEKGKSQQQSVLSAVPSLRSFSSKTSSLRRRERDLQLTMEEELAKIEEEYEAKEMKRRQKLVKMRIEARKADLRDELDTCSEGETVDFDQNDFKILERTGSEVDKVEDWLDSQHDAASILSVNSKDEVKSQIVKKQVIQDAGAAVQAAGKSQLEVSDTRILLARQTVGRDLQPFFGKAEEWPMFLQQFNRSTKLCHFSADENMMRLQKALRGAAKETVQAMMYSPDNIDLVMKTLERRFGRPDHIIEVLIEKAKAAAGPKESDLESLVNFANAVMNLAMTMESLNCPHHLHNPQLLKELVSKLPSALRMKWGRKIEKSSPQHLSIKDFATWLNLHADAVSHVSKPKEMREEDAKGQLKPNQQKKKDVVFTAVNTGGGVKSTHCSYCDVNGHIIFKCEKFLKLTVEARWDWVAKCKACFCCLRKGHQVSTCKSTKLCQTEGCQKRHNTLLHKEMKKEENAVTNNDPVLIHTVDSSEPVRLGKKVLLRILEVVLRGPKGELTTYALFDEGSTITMVDSSISKMLGLKGQPDPLQIQWTNDVIQEDSNSMRVTLEIAGKQNKEFFRIQNARTRDNINLPIQTADVKRMSIKWDHLKTVNVDSLNDAQPMILIGQDNIDLIVAREVVEGGKNSPMLTRSKLGWVVHGNVATVKGRVDTDVIFHIAEKDEELHHLVKDYFKTESFGVKVMTECPRSKEDKEAEKIFQETTKRVPTDVMRWETGLLWRSPDVKLPESKKMAMRRLFQLEKKLDSDGILADKYYTKMDEYLSKGYLQKLTQQEAATHGDRLWYLPHFAATHPNKPGKIRLVFDAAAKSNGTSLNDALFTGPDLLNPLVGVLFKFRQRRIGFTGDIQEMFHQVNIKSEDLDAQRILWRGRDRTKSPEEYVMPVMTFGSACSPFSAQSVKNQNAKEYADSHPSAASAILWQHYMDDYLDSKDTEDEATKIIQDVSYIHLQGSFKIRSWTSNSQEVLEKIPKDLRADKSKNFNEQGLSMERVLGIKWIPDSDNFTFSVNLNRTKAEILDGTLIPTKREVLRLVMSIFDPLGFVSHLTIKAKILLRSIWKSGVGWDDEVPQSLAQKWILWVMELKSLPDVQIPRCYSLKIPNSTSIQLHVLCDASESAFAAVAYLRVQDGEEVDVGFVLSKTRVSPVRQMSIPRLELQAAVLGSRMSECIKKEHSISINSIHFWTDSKTVLCWLRAENRTFKTFVAHRVGEIEELTDIKNWRWVPTKLNVADDATRDVSPTDLNPSGRWFTGPEFLKLKETEWPVENFQTLKQEMDIAESEMKQEIVMMCTPIKPFIEAHRFSEYLRFVRTIGWIKRFAANCHKKRISGELTVDEMLEAEKIGWNLSQHQSFPDDISRLSEGKPISSNSRLSQLSPYLDEDALLRMDGRIREAAVGENVKNPIILDPKNQITRLIIMYFHEKAHHNGLEHVLNELRQQFWILNARTAVRSAWSSCQYCKNRRARPIVPEMGALPAVRVNGFVRAFTHTGVDYFGPMEVTIGRRREKRYGALFTCLTTRAIHLEVAASLTTDSCIMAIRRMIARRGCPVNLFSDNGTNFRGADNELRRSLEELDQNQILTEMGIMGIRWTFNPPAAPHMGGVWERMVRSVKTALKATLNEQAPKEEVLLTLLLEAESLINSRPLTHVSIDPKDPESLTPNHFLIGTSSSSQPMGIFDDDDMCLRKQWRKSQRLADLFWKRWMKEYLPTLTRREKWHIRADPVQVGDVVVIADPDFPRSVWPRGIITATFPGKDGQVRVVEVKTGMGTFRRPVAKICVLDVLKLGDEPLSNTVGENVVDTVERS